MKNIFFENETEMSFWMGIYQTAMNSQPALSGRDDAWCSAGAEEKNPALEADKAVREFRRRLEPPKGQYHNSPK